MFLSCQQEAPRAAVVPKPENYYQVVSLLALIICATFLHFVIYCNLMKKIFSVLAVFLLLTACGHKNVTSRPVQTLSEPENITRNETMATSSFYDFKLNSIDGEPIDFSRYKGKKVLLVNVASKCGYTPQYEKLQQLHKAHGQEVVILGFPANNFGGQEPGSNDEIKDFCQKNYGVDFQMFEKISVKGNDMHPLYKWLSTKELNGWNEEAPSWNFSKYLINEEGELMKMYGSAIDPMGDEILKAIKA